MSKDKSESIRLWILEKEKTEISQWLNTFNIESEEPGTVFRLPLRNDRTAHQSDISHEIFKYEDYDTFLKKNKKSRIVLMTTKAKKNYHKFEFEKNDMLLFGRESAGVPENLHNTIKDKVKIPMNKKTRSLNVAMSVAIISAEALRQNNLLK